MSVQGFLHVLWTQTQDFPGLETEGCWEMNSAGWEPQPVIFILVIDSAPLYPEVTLCNSQNDKIQWLTRQDPHRDLFTLDLFWWWQCNNGNSLPLPCRLRPAITVMDDWVWKTIPFLSSPTLFDLGICLYLSLETTWCLSAFIHIPHKEAILMW